MVLYRISISLEVFTAPSPSCVVSMGPSRLIEREIGPKRHAAWHGWGVASPSRMPRCLWLRQSCKVRLLEAQMTSSNKKPLNKKGRAMPRSIYVSFWGDLLSADCWVLCIFQSLTALPVLSDLFSYRLDSLRMAQEHRHEIKQTMNACILVLGAWTQHLL